MNVRTLPLLFASALFAVLPACSQPGTATSGATAAAGANAESKARQLAVAAPIDADPFDPAAERVAERAKSTNLPDDLKLMWETKLIGGEGTGVVAEHRFASTYRAINAASRVFNTVDLKGQSREQVIAQLGNPKTSSQSIYNFPFFPPKSGDLVYRFDAGNGGWQFNIHFDANGKVSVVDRLPIG